MVFPFSSTRFKIPADAKIRADAKETGVVADARPGKEEQGPPSHFLEFHWAFHFRNCSISFS